MKKYNYKISPACLDALVDEGFNQNQIAKCCGVSRQAIHSRIHSKKSQKANKSDYNLASWLFWRNEGFSMREIAEVTGSNHSAIAMRFRRLKIYCVDGRAGNSGRPKKVII